MVLSTGPHTCACMLLGNGVVRIQTPLCVADAGPKATKARQHVPPVAALVRGELQSKRLECCCLAKHLAATAPGQSLIGCHVVLLR
jgi:hypothetical protein